MIMEASLYGGNVLRDVRKKAKFELLLLLL
jgi:hypothetical protein